jgi:hypothetical protein
MNAGLNTTVKDDLEFGLKNEISILPKLHKHFMDNTITKTENRYEIYDYEADDGTHYEVKTRRITKRQFPTTLLPCHKICHTKEQYFIFSFLDQDSFIKYRKDQFDTYETMLVKDCRKGMNGKKVNHYLIPVGDLTDF